MEGTISIYSIDEDNITLNISTPICEGMAKNMRYNLSNKDLCRIIDRYFQLNNTSDEIEDAKFYI